MLSFLREQELEDSSEQKVTAGEVRPDNTGEKQQKEYLTVAAQNKNVRKTTILLAALFGIGMLCLWFMIRKTVPQTASASSSSGVSAEQAQIEKAISKLTGVRSEMFMGIQRIVKKFYEFSDVQQVQVHELIKNPFNEEIFLGKISETSDIKEKNLDSVGLQQEAKNLHLLCIMSTDSGNCCMIDDKVLFEGDSIKGFKVRQISDSFVKLEWAGIESGSEGVKGYPQYSQSHLGTQIILKLSQ
ncbi:MAG: hypothetical protein ACYS0I_06800 [Planctomycetota bacterium]|jgi:hypothetical protein